MTRLSLFRSSESILPSPSPTQIRIRCYRTSPMKGVELLISLVAYYILVVGVISTPIVFGVVQNYNLEVILTLVIWIATNRRGTILVIRLDEKNYTTLSHIIRKTRKGLPSLHIIQRKTPKGWRSELCIDHRFTAYGSTAESESAARIEFDILVNQIHRRRDCSHHRDPEMPVAATICTQRVGNSGETTKLTKTKPLVLLVHGTWARCTSWATPTESWLVEKLSAKMSDKPRSCEVDFDAFVWSGAISPMERTHAARGLSMELEYQLNLGTRPIFVIAHSHGGNIAMEAHKALADKDQSHVHCFFLETPFLLTSRIDMRTTFFSDLPEWMSRWSTQIIHLCFLATLVLIGLVTIGMTTVVPECAYRDGYFDFSFNSCKIQLLLILSLAFVLFLWIFFSFKRELFLKYFGDSNRSFQGKHFVIRYEPDELYRLLSTISNIFSIVQAAIFFIFGQVFRIIRKISASLFREHFVFMVIIAIIFGLLGLVLRYVADFAKTRTELMWLHSYLFDIGSTFARLAENGFQLFAAMPFAPIVWTIATISVALISIVFLGIIRALILTIFGIAGYVRSWQEVVDLFLGNISVSTTPVGVCQTLTLCSSSIFGHTRIYDEKATVEFIVDCIESCLHLDEVKEVNKVVK